MKEGLPSLLSRVRLLRFLIESQGAPSPLAWIDGTQTHSEYVTNRETLFDALKGFSAALRVIPSIPVVLHVTAHGNTIGIQAGNEIVAWSDLKPCLAALNAACGDRLLLCMSSCKGVSAAVMALSDGQPPFHTIVGAEDNIGIGVNANWHSFYGRLANGESLDAAFDSLQAECKAHRERFFMLTAAELQLHVSLQ